MKERPNGPLFFLEKIYFFKSGISSDMILAERRKKGTWPVKHSTVNFFNVQRDLVKIRFHHSEKYQHIPVRIPKSEKNKGE